jgi:hypothetical protein
VIASQLEAALAHLSENPEPGTPTVILELARELLDTMNAEGWTPSTPSPSLVTPAPPAQQLAVQQEASGRMNVRAKTPYSERSAGAIQKLLDALAGWPISPLADAALDFAAHVEALELENRTLRAHLLVANQGRETP